MQQDGLSSLLTEGVSGLGGATARSRADKAAKVIIYDLNENAGQPVVQAVGDLFMIALPLALQDSSRPQLAHSSYLDGVIQMDQR